jgi:hypothetical protein
MTSPDGTPGVIVSPSQRTALIEAARYVHATIDSGDIVDAGIELADLVLDVFGGPASRQPGGTSSGSPPP